MNTPMTKPGSGRPAALRFLVFLLIFLGLNGIVAGLAFMVAPDGHLIQMPMSNLERAPFRDFLLPGILLFIFIGIYPVVIGYSLWRLPNWSWPDALNPWKGIHWSWAGSLAAGVAAIVWIVVQVQWIQFGMLHGIVLAWGGLILGVTLLPGIPRYCRRQG
jgi:hypothetical protein